jgi:CBS domain-containing protein
MMPPRQHRWCVRDLMKTDVTVIPALATVDQATVMLTRAHVSGAPVLAGEHVVGVVTMSDLARWSRPHDPDSLAADHAPPRAAGNRRVGDLLERRPITARPDWPVARALEAMHAGGVQRLPVLEEHGRLVGVVARDVLLAVAGGSAISGSAADAPDR